MERKCRICGCTENDCSQCIKKTGEPCYWVDEDLCSACVNETSTDNQNQIVSMDNVQSSDQSLEPVFGTADGFFRQLANNPPGVDLNLRIKEKNGKFTVSVLPMATDNSTIQPLIITGTPAELDQEFFKKIGPVLRESTLAIVNADAHRKSVEGVSKKENKKPASEANSVPGKSATKTAKQKAKVGSKKTAPVKKTAEKKPEKAKPAPAAEDAPKVQEQQIF